MEELVKKIDLFSDKNSKTNNQFQVTNDIPRDEEIKCSNCDFVAKNENSLKVHMKAKHTEPQKFTCKPCDFSCATKSELTAHNDVYWDSHRMCFYPVKKKYYLAEIDQMKRIFLQ